VVGFPITGPYRELLLTLEFIILFTFMELSIFFFSKFWKNRKESNRSIVEFDWGVFFACFGTAKIFFIMGDFFGFDHIIFPTYGYFSLAIGGTIFLYHIESNKILPTKFFSTAFFGIFTLVLLVVFLVNPQIIKTVAYSLGFGAFAILLFYFSIILRRIWNQYRLNSIGLLIGISLWLLGFLGTSDVAIALFNGFEIRIAGDIGLLTSLLCVGLFLNSIPSLAEIGWQGKVKYVILTTRTGINLYTENFQEKKTGLNEVLVAGALWGVQSFLQTVLSDSHLRVLSKGTDVILMEYGKHIVGILIVEQELETLKLLLKKLVTEFEYFYADIVENWKGDLSIFKPTAHLINEIFSLKKG